MSAPLLQVENLEAGYGPINVLHELSLTVERGEIVTMIGANGAGKTTTLMCHLGRREGPRRGRSSSTAATSSRVSRRTTSCGSGLAQSPEGRKIFPRLTVLENLRDGRVHTHRPRRRDGRHREGVRDVPDPQEAAGPGRRTALRRRAADARHRPGTHGPARSYCCSTSRRWAWPRRSSCRSST